MTPDPRALVTPGGICIETDEDGEPKGVIIITSNESERVLLYKLKTNAPSKYVVKQSLGVLMPGQKREITCTVRPKTDDSSDDKFQLEIRTVTEGEEGTLRGYAGSRDMTKCEDDEKEIVSKMWKEPEAGEEVAKNQYMLLLQSEGPVEAEALPKKTVKVTKAKDAKAKEDAEGDLVSKMGKEAEAGGVAKSQYLLLLRSMEAMQKKTTKDAYKEWAKQREVKIQEEANKAAASPRKSVPLWLSILFVLNAFGLGIFFGYCIL